MKKNVSVRGCFSKPKGVREKKVWETLLWNIVFLPTPRLCKWSLTRRFARQNPVCTPPQPHTCHTSFLLHSSFFDHEALCYVVLSSSLLYFPS